MENSISIRAKPECNRLEIYGLKSLASVEAKRLAGLNAPLGVEMILHFLSALKQNGKLFMRSITGGPFDRFARRRSERGSGHLFGLQPE